MAKLDARVKESGETFDFGEYVGDPDVALKQRWMRRPFDVVAQSIDEFLRPLQRFAVQMHCTFGF